MIRDPYALLRAALGGPLHPGGHQATEALLNRARVGQGTRLVDLGCGAGEAVVLARKRGAKALGVDRRRTAGSVCATLTHLPFSEASFEVALTECTLCLAPDLEAALSEARRILVPDGRLALSDVVVDRSLEHVERPLARALCMDGERSRGHLLAAVEAAGFEVLGTQDHRDELLAMRDRLRRRVDVDGLLASLGDRGARLRRAVDEIEGAVEAGDVGYVSLVARRTEK